MEEGFLSIVKSISQKATDNLNQKELQKAKEYILERAQEGYTFAIIEDAAVSTWLENEGFQVSRCYGAWEVKW